MYLQNVTFLSESNGIRRTTVLQEPVSDRLHPGDSVTLYCSVISQICAGEYSVYWFRHSSGRSDPGIIYTHGNSSDQCMKRSENGSSTQSCVYSLSQTELTTSDAGIYYCAVATCGKIHLGNGTKLNIEGTYIFNFLNIFDVIFLESSCYNPLHNKHNIHYCEHISAETDSQESQKRYKIYILT